MLAAPACTILGGDFARSITTAQQALEKLPLSDSYLRGFARGYQSISYLAIGDLTQAYATFYQTWRARSGGQPDCPGCHGLLHALARSGLNGHGASRAPCR